MSSRKRGAPAALLVAALLVLAQVAAMPGTPSATAATAATDPMSACALPNRVWMGEGVPTDWTTFTRPVGTVRAAVLFRGSWNIDTELAKLKQAGQLYATASYGRYQLELVPYRTPVVMSTVAAPPEMIGDVVPPGTLASAWGEAAKRADSNFDFSSISTVFLIDSGTSRSYMQSDSVTLDGRTIKVGAVIGSDWPSHRHKLLAHEGGHTIGLPDLYGGSGGHGYVGGWDLMGNLGGPAPDHFAWHKWKLGWLDDNQMSCLATRNTSVQQTLTPVETAGGGKAIVVRYGTTRAYVAEVRALRGLDSGACDTGVLVYSIDSAVQGGAGPVRVQDAKPRSGGCGGNELNDGAYDPGQSFVDSANQVRISVLSRSGDDYVVRATFGQSSQFEAEAISAPVMGWNSWNRFGCNISESLIRATADAIVANDLDDLGYRYVNIDDCWMASTRDGQGRLQPHPTRFPTGIKALADYVHARGLKLGIYSSAGTRTCQGYPASLDHETVDAQTFAAWGVDLLKYDNCNNQGRPNAERYKKMGDALKATGRPIVYSICNWGEESPWVFGPQVGGDYWRTTADISDNWNSAMGILDLQVGLESFARKGAYNDPDMLEVGNGGMTTAEYVSHFSLWSLLSAPLLLGNDLRSMSATTLGIIRNREVVAVNQDWGGAQGRRIRDDGSTEVWAKPMSDGSVAVVLFNRGSATTTISTSTAQLGLAGSSSYGLRDLWNGTTSSTTGTISASVAAHAVVMYRVSRAGTLAAGPAAGAHQVGNMTWQASTNGYGPVERNRSNGEQAAGDGRTLTVNGTTYAQGIGTHADSAVHLYLGRVCGRFTAQVGIDDEVTNSAATARFLVYGDGKLLADSGVKTASQGSSTLDVATTGYATLELRVTDGRNGISYDHADWGAPILSCG